MNEVRFDSDNQTWRLVNPETSSQFAYSRPVKRNEKGIWSVHSDVGLKGSGLKELFKNNNADIGGINYSDMLKKEQLLFSKESCSVRVDSPNHSMLVVRRRNQKDKIEYVFYDPNYGIAYFDKYKDMLAFFESKMKEYNYSSEELNYTRLDYSNADEKNINRESILNIVCATSMSYLL